jgi:glycerophosphoryl diester phosphodiesterase
VHGLPQDGRITDTDYKSFTTSEMVEQAHSLGLKVIPWTIDDRAMLEYYIDLGVDGIITNYPDRLVDVLQSRRLLQATQ